VDDFRNTPSGPSRRRPTRRRPRELDLLADVVFRHQEEDDAHARAVCRWVEDRVLGVAADLHDLVEPLAGQGLEGVVLELDEEEAVRRARGPAEVLPAHGRRPHLRDHARARGRIGDALEEGVVAARARPGRDAGIEAGRARGVGVHVRGDAEPLPPRGLDLRDGLVQLGPVGRARRLQVVDLRGHVRLARNGDQLVDRLQNRSPSRRCEM
jgi:hypothetical protein